MQWAFILPINYYLFSHLENNMNLSRADQQWCAENAHFLTFGTDALDCNVFTFQDVANAIWTSHRCLFFQNKITLEESRAIASVFESYIVAKIR